MSGFLHDSSNQPDSARGFLPVSFVPIARPGLPKTVKTAGRPFHRSPALSSAAGCHEPRGILTGRAARAGLPVLFTVSESHQRCHVVSEAGL
jgi:hypothetical protein